MMVSRSTPPRRHSRDDDVPELNDAVEELSLHPLPDDEGEVSRWLEVDLAKASITGPAPDSHRGRPAVNVACPPPHRGRDAPLRTAGPRNARHRRAARQPRLFAQGYGHAASGNPRSHLRPAIPGFDAMLGTVACRRRVRAGARAVSCRPAASGAPRPRTDESPAPVRRIAEAAPPATPDERQWEGLAEEIRMQVLQRIDIFTDTGLQGELAARLQPIVDRASADLVTTINREVGPDPARLRCRSHRARDRDVARKQSVISAVRRLADCARVRLPLDCALMLQRSIPGSRRP